MIKNFRLEIILFFVLILFSVYRYFSHVEVRMLKMFSPTMFALDFNGNRSIENDEIVCVSGIKTIGDNLLVQDYELVRKLGLSKKEVLSLGYLTKDFTESFFANSVVEFVPDEEQNKLDCVVGDIFVDKKSYKESLLKQGLAYSEDFFEEKSFKYQRELAKKINPVIMNRKSKKYHEIGCKYGEVASDAVVLIKEDLPQNAVPCKWCHKGEEVVKIEHSLGYPDRITSGTIKMFLTDMASHLKVKSDCSSQICQMFLQEINSAQKSIDIATYGWVSIDELDEALKNAVERGVKFRFVYDYSAKDNYYPDSVKISRLAVEAKNDLIAGDSKLTEYLMHNKFMVFDNKKVVTGSLNYSKTDFSEFNSNVIFFVDSPQLAQIYTAEFEQMLKGKFHTQKKKNGLSKKIFLADSSVEVYFSPQDEVITKQVVTYLDNAQKYIYMPIFVLTHKEIEKALLRAQARGVDVKIIVDATNVFAKASSVKMLRDSGVLVKVENFAGKLHSKSIIIDDEYILSGSMNFSYSGENRNDENMLILKNSRLSSFYREYFEYLWNKIPNKYLKQIPRAEGEESVGSCFDGIDNDFDGRIDKADEGCFVK